MEERGNCRETSRTEYRVQYNMDFYNILPSYSNAIISPNIPASESANSPNRFVNSDQRIHTRSVMASRLQNLNFLIILIYLID